MNLITKFLERFSLRMDFRRALVRLAMAPVVLLFSFTIVIWISNKLLLDMNAEVVHSRSLVNTSHELMLSFLNMETGLRGYIASSGNPIFLEPYWEGGKKVPLLLKTMERMVGINADHETDLAKVKDLFTRWASYAEGVRKNVAAHKSEGIKPFFDGEGKQLMDSVRSSLGNIISAEELSSIQKGAQISKAVRQATSLTLLFLVVAGFFLILHTQREIRSLNASFQNNIRAAEEAHNIQRTVNETLERTVASRTAELEAFCYSVSHDLRAPLRGIDGFSLALVEDYSPLLPEQAKKYLQFVRQGVQKMGKLIDDLLALSRVSRKELSFEAVDLGTMATEAVAELREAEPTRKVKFKAVSHAQIVGDRGMLQAMMTNLLSNAWKFTKNNDDAELEFGQLEKDGKKVFFVRDNGAGFDMAHYDKLFGAFQRLHSPSEFQGTGIGLATVKRIVSRHGGEAWAEGQVGVGATFYFVLANPADIPPDLIPKGPLA